MLRFAMKIPGSIHRFEAERDGCEVICQDHYAIREGRGVIAGVLCDGAGSYSHAHIGAQAMSHRIADELVGRAGFYLSSQCLHEQVDALIGVIRRQLSQLSENWSEPEDAFSSTLLAVLMDKRSGSVAVYHLGDGVILGADRDEPLRALSAAAPSESRYATWLTTCTADEIRQAMKVYHGTAERVFMASDGGVGTLFSADGMEISPSVEEFIAAMKREPDALADLDEMIREELNPFDDFSMVLLDASMPDAWELAPDRHSSDSLRVGRRALAYVRSIDAGASVREARYASGISPRSYVRRYQPLLASHLLV